jgi:outer membrane protein|tara:strand:- start:3211 stop:4521 length:1311 start_codon:yes stop_codon:yes gene_type:complete
MYKALTKIVITAGLAMPSAAATLVDVAEAALANNPQVQIATLSMNMDKQQSLIQYSAFEPQVSVSGSLGLQSQRGSNYEDISYLAETEQLTLTQKLFDVGAVIVQSSLDFKVEEARFKLLETEGMVLLDVTEKYVQAAIAIDTMNLQQQEERYNAKLLKSVKHKFRLKEVYITDVHMAQAKYDLSVSETLISISEVSTALKNLSQVAGIEVSAFKPENQLYFIIQEYELEYWLAQAKEFNYALRAAGVASTVALKSLDAHAFANFPVIDARFNIKNQTNRGGSTSAPGASGLSFVITLNMPLYQGGRVEAQRQFSKDNYAITLQQRKQIEQELTSRVTVQYLREQAMGKRIKAIERALASTQEATQAIRTGLDYGVSTQGQLLASTKQEFELQLQLKQATYQATLSSIQLRHMAGQLTTQYLRELSKQLPILGNDV